MPLRDVVGHRRLIDLLRRSVSGGTLPPSLLFAGPAGVGKRLTALAVAQTLNCLRSGKANPASRPRANPESLIPNPGSRFPANPESQIPSPGSRFPANPESQIPNPGS